MLREDTHRPQARKEVLWALWGHRNCPNSGKPRPSEGRLRCSGKVKLVAALDVVHQVSSIEKFHHKKEVFLGKSKNSPNF